MKNLRMKLLSMLCICKMMKWCLKQIQIRFLWYLKIAKNRINIWWCIPGLLLNSIIRLALDQNLNKFKILNSKTCTISNIWLNNILKMELLENLLKMQWYIKQVRQDSTHQLLMELHLLHCINLTLLHNTCISNNNFSKCLFSNNNSSSNNTQILLFQEAKTL